MKKYFMKGVDEPLEFGDTLGFDIVKEGDKGQSITKHVECKFIPEIVPLLLDEGIIEKKEVEEPLDFKPIDFQDDEEDSKEEGCDVTEAIDEIDSCLEELTEIAGKAEKKIADLERRVKALEDRKDIKDRSTVKDKESTNTYIFGSDFDFDDYICKLIKIIDD